MKKFLLGLLFAIMSTVAMGQYSSEPNERYVGQTRGKYPLTLQGLQAAISNLDSGVVYIAYPGLSDTTGLGTIPSNIYIQGWMNGSPMNSSVFIAMDANDITQPFDSLEVTGDARIGGDLEVGGSLLVDGAVSTNVTDNPDSSIFKVIRLGANWWGASDFQTIITDANNDLAKNPLTSFFGLSYTSSSGTRTQGMDVQRSTLTLEMTGTAQGGSNTTYPLTGVNGTNARIQYTDAHSINLEMASGFVSWFNIGGAGSDITQNYFGYYSGGHRWGGSRVIDNWYGYYSAFPIGGAVNNFYHFYGAGNYPSYFGGDLLVEGYLEGDIKTHKIVSDTTLAASLMKGGVFYVMGAYTVTLAPVEDGLSITLFTVGDNEVSLDVDDNDLQVLDGIALSDGDKATNLSTAGNMAVVTYFDDTGWYTATDRWTNGN
jgi:hypothetical protein